MMNRSGTIGIILIVIGVLGLSFLGAGFGPWTWGPGPFQGGPMWLAMHGGGCVSCHGVSGRGGVPVMMGTAIPADIRYAALTTEDAHEKGKEEEEHPPYTDELIKRAITQGLDPAGKSLDWTMPRWQMTEEDLNDLIAYLKTLR